MQEDPSFFGVHRSKILAFLAGALAFLLVFGSLSFVRLAFKPGFGQGEMPFFSSAETDYEALNVLGEDLNEIRSLLLLPAKDYSFLEERQEEQVEEDASVLIYQFLETLGSQEKTRKLLEKNRTAAEQSYGLGILNEMDSQLEFPVKDEEGVLALTVNLSTNNGEFAVAHYQGVLELSNSKDFESVQAAVNQYLAEDWSKAKLKKEKLTAQRDLFVNSYLNSPAMTGMLQELGLHFESEWESTDALGFTFANGEESVGVEIRIEKHNEAFFAEGKEGFTAFELNEGAIESLKSIWSTKDLRSDLEQLVEQREEEMQMILEDPAFVSTLKKAELQIGERSETETRIQYPVLDLEGNLLRTFFIDKSTGEFNVENVGAVEPLAQALQTLQSGDDPKKKTSSSPLLFLA